ncbi:MAG: hypothetical protein O7F12_14965 [Nitrospirae bacterium]|nr:hypothetical protein [Nitrospirota bacterium]
MQSKPFRSSRFWITMLLAVVAGTSAHAGSLAIGPFTNEDDCKKFCKEMVWGCNTKPVYSPTTEMCLVSDGQGRNIPPEGFAVQTDNEPDCKKVAKRLGSKFYWDPDTEWCIEGGSPRMECKASDWAGLWNTQHGEMRLNVSGSSVTGRYAGRGKTLPGDNKMIENGKVPAVDPCVIDAYWQHPPKGKGKRGRVRFEMDKKKHFKGWYTYKEAVPDTQSTPNWTGSK